MAILSVICLHWFKLFRLGMSSFTHIHDTDLHVCTEAYSCKLHTLLQSLPCSLSASAISLIYGMLLIWPKRLLRDLPSLSSLHLLRPSFSSSFSSVTRQSKSENCGAQQAIHRVDTLTNILLSFSLPHSFPFYLTLSASLLLSRSL